MSFFAVTLEEIESVSPIPKTDRLDMTSLRGMAFRFVTERGKHKAGDRVLYFPLDSVIPQEALRTMGVEGKLSGTEKNRLSTVILRGFPSQGLVEFPDRLLPAGFESLSPTEITEALGVTKFELPPEVCEGGTLVSLPHGLSGFDIEGADRFQDVLGELMDQIVVVTEKAEGSNFSAGVREEGTPFVNQRLRSIVENPGETTRYWNIARELGLIEGAREIQKAMSVDGASPLVAIYGEIYGPAYYGLKDFELGVFGIKVDFGFVGWEEQKALLAAHCPKAKLVPIVSEGTTLRAWLTGRTLVEASHGKSLFNPAKLREGVVVAPEAAQSHDRIGRLILKQRDPIYLGKTGNV